MDHELIAKIRLQILLYELNKLFLTPVQYIDGCVVLKQQPCLVQARCPTQMFSGLIDEQISEMVHESGLDHISRGDRVVHMTDILGR